jgi:mRNA-degrading endonuclease YafQ of YafQ-DinJ toxin-antitoxin module
MREIFTTGRFDKRLTAFIGRHPELNAETQASMELIAKDPYASSLRTHRLKGALAECFASRLSREYRIVFIFNTIRVVFLDIGTHDDVYR